MPAHRKPHALHDLQGTTSKALLDKPSLYKAGRPRIPAHLSPVARAEFKRIAKLLEERSTATPGDMATIAVLAEVYARWVQAKDAIGDALMIQTTIKDTNGEPVVVERLNPLLKVVSDCERQIRSLTKELGLTPSSRDRVRPAIDGDSKSDEPEPGTVGWTLLHGGQQ